MKINNWNGLTAFCVFLECVDDLQVINVLRRVVMRGCSCWLTKLSAADYPTTSLLAIFKEFGT